MVGLLAIAAGSFLLVACSVGAVPSKADSAKPKPQVPPGAVLLQGAGATFPAPLYEEWFRRYQASHPQSVISYDAVGSGEGVRRFIGQNVTAEEQVDFGASDAAMRDDEIAQVRDGAVMLPVTAGAVTLAYNLPSLGAELKLSRQAYVGIFIGRIRTWNDPLIARANPGVPLPNLTITTVVRQDGSGTTFALTKYLDAISDEWRARYGAATLVDWPGSAMRPVGNEGVAGRIKQAIGSIGYVSREFARRAGLKTAVLENRSSIFVAPTDESTAAALAGAELPANLRAYVPDPAGHDAYPVVTLTWILLHGHQRDRQKAMLAHDLFHWCLTEGQQYATALGYTPLSQDIVDHALHSLDRVTTSDSSDN